MKDTLDSAVGKLMQAQAILERLAKQQPRVEGSLVGLPSPRDILEDAVYMIDEVIEYLDEY